MYGLVGNTKALEFAGTNDSVKQFFTLPNMSSLTQGEMMIWMKRNTGSSYNRIHRIGTASDGYYPYSGLGVYDAFGTTSRKDGIFSASIPPTNIWHSYDVYSASSNWGMRLNDGGIGNYSTGSNTVGFNSSPRLGADYDGSSYASSFLGHMAEVVITSSVLSSAQRTAVYDYFLEEYT